MNIITKAFRNKISEGNSKIVYQSDVKGQFHLYFKESDSLNDFGVLKKSISDIFFSLLTDCGINNHFIVSTGIREQKVVALEMLPFFFTVHAYATQSISQRFFIPNGTKLNNYLIEIMVKNANGETPIAREHIVNFNWLQNEKLDYIQTQALRVMDVFSGFFKALNITLFSVDLRFGKKYKQDAESFDCILGDEITLKNLKIRLNDSLTYDEKDTYFKLAERLSLLK